MKLPEKMSAEHLTKVTQDGPLAEDELNRRANILLYNDLKTLKEASVDSLFRMVNSDLHGETTQVAMRAIYKVEMVIETLKEYPNETFGMLNA